MNFSHGSYEVRARLSQERLRRTIDSNLNQYHQSVIDNAREAARVQTGRPLAIALDTKGPEIRTGNTVGDKDFPISAGTELNITTDEAYATASDDKNM